MGGLKDKMRMKTFGRCVNTREHYRTSGSKMRSLLFSVKESGILTLPIWEVKLYHINKSTNVSKTAHGKMVRQ